MVLAVVLTMGVSGYLPETLRGVAAQRTSPDAVLLVDGTPRPDPGHARTLALRALAQESGLPLEHVRVVHTPTARTPGDGVRLGLAELAAQGSGGADLASPRWLWLLHDDSAPEPATLAELLRAAKSGPTVAITGAKQRDWSAPERLLELGVTVSRSGRRFLGHEEGELDQGQHDDRFDVYGVGTAGALVLTRVWDELGGTDPALGPFGDGLDLSRRARLAGYRVVVAPRAVVRHARAGLLGLRPAPGAADDGGTAALEAASRAGDPRRSFRARRLAVLHTQLVQTRAPLLPVVVPAILLWALVRAVVRLLTKEFRLAGDEVAAAVAAVSRPRALRRARVQDRRTRRLPPRRLKRLRASTRDVWRVGHDRRMQAAALRRGTIVRSELELAERAALRARRRWTLALVVLGLAAASSTVLGGVFTGGPLTGGALLPLRSGARSLWETAVGSWFATADGHAAPADPFTFVLAGLTLAAGGSSRVAVTALVLGAVPLAGVGAWYAAGAATRSVRLRAWAAVGYAVAPPLVLALGQGRLGPVVAHLALPWVALGAARALGVERRDRLHSPGQAVPRDRGGSVAAAAGGGLALAVAAAGSPVLLPAALVALVLLAPLVPRRRGVLALLAVPPLLLLAPLLVEAVATAPAGGWRVLVADPGVPLASEVAADHHPALGWPVDPVPWPALPADAAAWAPLVGGALLLLGAVVALLRRGRLRGVRAGWVVLVVGLATAVASARVEVGPGAPVPGGVGSVLVRGWPGTGTSLVVLGVLIAVVTAADGLVGRLAATSFGLRHVVAAGLTALLLVVPVAHAAAWVWQGLEARRSGEPGQLLAIGGSGPGQVPALGAELQAAHGARVLALSPADGELRVGLWRDAGDQLEERSSVVTARSLTGPPGEPDPVPADAADRDLAELAAALSSGTAADAGDGLARHAVGVVVVPPGAGDARDTLVARLDASASLERVTENETGTVWRVATGDGLPPARARVVDAQGAATQVLASSGTRAAGRVPAGDPGRLVVLAERADPGWRAWADGRPLRSRTVGWQQAFELPPEGGRVTVAHQSWTLTLVHSAQAVVIGAFAVLALPLRRRRAGVG